MLKRAFRKMRYAILLLKVGGPKVFIRQLRHQLYSRTTHVGLERNLDTDFVQVPSRIEYSFQLATEEDIEEILQKAKTESKESAFDLIQQKWFYESGFRNCYIVRTADTGELCHVNWLMIPNHSAMPSAVSPGIDDAMSQVFGSLLPWMKDDECLGANAYTFEKYRGYGIFASVNSKLFDIGRNSGMKRMISYVRQDNVASLKSSARVGFKNFEEVHELKLLFLTRWKHIPCQKKWSGDGAMIDDKMTRQLKTRPMASRDRQSS